MSAGHHGLTQELPHLWTLRVVKLARLHWITFYWIILRQQINYIFSTLNPSLSHTLGGTWKLSNNLTLLNIIENL